MTFEQLKTFVTVARLLSFSRAAEMLYLSQPAVSMQIRALEREYGVRLFERVGRRVLLTEAGRILLEASETILRTLEETRQAIDELGGLKRGTLRLGASLVVGIYILPETLGRFKQRYPAINVSLQIGYATRVVEHVLDNRVDLGLIAEGAVIQDRRLASRPFATDELVVITPREARWCARTTVTLDEIVEEPFIISEAASATRGLIERRVREAGRRLNIIMELGNIEAIKKAVEAGLGISVMSRCAVAYEVETGRLCALTLADVPLRRHLYLVWCRGRDFSPLIEAFLTFLPT